MLLAPRLCQEHGTPDLMSGTRVLISVVCANHAQRGPYPTGHGTRDGSFRVRHRVMLMGALRVLLQS